MARESERREAGLFDDNAEFFAEFADQRLFRPLADIELPAGEFPEIGEVLAHWALSDQHEVVGVDERCGDDEEEFQARAPEQRHEMIAGETAEARASSQAGKGAVKPAGRRFKADRIRDRARNDDEPQIGATEQVTPSI